MTLTLQKAFLTLAGLSFFSIGWLARAPGDDAAIEGPYAAILFFLTLIVAVARRGRRRGGMNPALLAHLAAILLASLTLAISPSLSYGLRDLALYVWLWVVHQIAGDLAKSTDDHVALQLYRILAILLVLSALSVAAAIASGNATFSLEAGEEVVDQDGMFLLSTDLISALIFMSLSAYHFLEKRPWFLGVTLVACIVLFLNFSKTYLAATALSLTLFWAVVNIRSLKGVLLIFISLAGIVLVLYSSNPFSRQLFWDHEVARDAIVSNPSVALDFVNSSGRIAIWEFLAQEGAKGHGGWLFGSGIGASRHILEHNPFGSIGRAAHGDYPRILAEYGTVGVAVYLLLMVAVLRKSIRTFRETQIAMRKTIAAALFMMTAYILIAGIGYEISNRYRYIMLLWFVLIACVYRNDSKKEGRAWSSALRVKLK